MKIRSIKIENIGGIRDLTIDFDDHMNFICGPNGVGKTTILECIAHSFSAYQTHILKKYANAECGKVIVVIDNNGSTITSSIGIDEFEPDKNSQIAGIKEHSIKLLSLKVTRTFQYQQLASVGRDAKKDSHLILDEAKSGLNLTEVKGWFVNRYLYSKHDDSLRKSQLYNFELAKRCFSLLNPDFSFKKILASTNEIIINSPSGEIYYEYLSSGFKSCLSILFGIIKDVEYRFEQPGMNADDFDGIILIDELELHLHPEWQSKIAKILNKTFPSAQFITSTHSPHIIQSANPREIIALEIDNNNVHRRPISGHEYGFQGWTVEEVLTDVMGMSDTRTDIYHEKLRAFEQAIESENYSSAESAFSHLDALLHPNNHLRKLLKLELASIKEAN